MPPGHRQVFYQDPSEHLDYAFDYIDWAAAGDTIADADVVASTGLTVDSVHPDGNRVTFWVSGGTVGVTYDVTVTATTVQGRTVERSVFFKIVDL